MKKLITVIILTLTLLITGAPLTALADTPYEIENPLYSGNQQMLKGGNLAFIEDSVSAKYDGKTYYTRGRQMYEYTKAKLDARKESFNIYCLSKYDINSTAVATNNITQMAFLGATDDELSKNSTDGDYIRWAVSSFGTASVKHKTKKNGYNYYIIKATFSYYDTVEQEKKVDAAISSFINSFKTSGKSDDRILREIHDYICNKTTYAYEALDDPYSHLYAFSPYGALIKGSCVCQGYAATFYRICKELGYGVRFVSSDANWGCHAWNIVELDGKYYVVDCTWDDEARDTDEDLGFDDYFYFLTDYDTSRANDTLYNQHTLYSSYYETEYFYANYKSKFTEKNYYPDTVKRLSDCKVTLSGTGYIYNSKAITPSVTVYDSGEKLINGKDYTVSYSSNVNAGTARVNITGKGDYAGTKTHRNFTIYPQKITAFSSTSVGSESIKLKWKAASGNVSGYAVQKYSDGKWRNVCTSAANTCTVEGLSPAEKQTLRVRAYKTVFKRNIYGAVSDTLTRCTRPEKTKIKTLYPSPKKLKVGWKKVKCTGYIIEYSTKKNMKGAKTVKVRGAKNTEKTLKRLKKNKKYYIRIRAYKQYKVSGKTKTVYGKYSPKKSIFIK